MSVNARFLADFESFYSAVQKAEVELKSMETGAGKVEASLNRMVDNFSGRKIAQDAILAAEAVDRIGGASKLTEAEQARVNRTVTEALAKYKALGQDAPEQLQKLARDTQRVDTATKQATTAAGNWQSSLKSAAGALGLAFGAQQVTAFIGKTFAAAGQINDLSQKLGVSAEAVQRWSFAAEQGGATIDDVDRALQFMNKSLGQGKASTIEALKAAGLEFTAIRTAKPETAFNEITEAIAGIEDPMTRARVAVELFGRSGQELLPAVIDNFNQTAASAKVMSDETIRRLAEAEDAWARFSRNATIYSGEAIAGVFRFFDGQWAGLPELADRAEIDKRSKGQLPQMPALPKSPLVGSTPVAPSADMDALLAYSDAIDKKLRAVFEKAADAPKELTKAIREYNDVIVPSLTYTEGMGLGIKRFGFDIKVTVPVVEDLNAAHRKATASMVEFTSWIPKTRAEQDAARVASVNLSDSLGTLSSALSQLSQVAGGSLGSVAGGFATIVSSADTAKKATDTFKSGLALAKSGEAIAGIAGMASGIAGIVAAAQAAAQAVKAIWSAFDRNKGRDLVKDFAESFGGFDLLHKQLLELGDAGEALWIKLTQGVGRNNPAQAERVIAEVEAALAKQAEAAGAAATMTEDGAQATIETAAAAAKALDDINGRLVTNAEAWGIWSGDVTGYLQKLADDILKMPLPGPTGAFPGTGTLSAAASTAISPPARPKSSTNTPIILQLQNGKVLAETMAEGVLGN